MSRRAFLNLNGITLSFQHLHLIEPLLKALNDEGYTTPTPIQEQAIPVILERKDLLGCAQTGTGKTAAFALPLLQLMCEDAAAGKTAQSAGPRPIRTLILTPTRELAIQIYESFAAYGRHTGIRHLVIYGGVPQHPQVQGLQRGTDVLVATPGRLLDLSNQRLLDLRQIRYFVLDEADRMLDMGFINDVRKILTLLPAKKQTLFFSATMPPEIQKLAGSILVDPTRVEVTPQSTTAETVQQSVYFVERKDKRSLLLHLLNSSSIPTALVFTRTKHGADKVAQGLTRAGIRAEAIHGNKSQNARQRALVNFKNRHTRILVATDIAARGIDIDDLTHVINFELPNVPETYVHRIGRTGRAGASGTALSFCDHEEKEFLHDIQKLISRQIPVVEDHPHVLDSGAFAPPVTSASHGNAGRNERQPMPDRESQRRKPAQNTQRRTPSNGGGEQQSQQRRSRPPAEGGEQNQQRRTPAEGGQQHQQRRERPPVEGGQPHQRLRSQPPAESDQDQHQQPVGRPVKREQPPVQTEGQAPDNGAKRQGRPDRPPVKRKNAGELKMPEQKNEYKDPLEDISLRINRSEGDEKW
jgi:ATP-dependent RNA helicase RhlE